MYSKIGYIPEIYSDDPNSGGGGGGTDYPAYPYSLDQTPKESLFVVDPPNYVLDEPIVFDDPIVPVVPIVPVSSGTEAVESTAESLDITGSVFDGATKQPLIVHGVLVNLRTKAVYDRWESDAYHVWNGDPNAIPNTDLAVEFSAAGYRTVVKTLPQLASEVNVYMHKGSSMSILILLAILFFIAFAKEKKKKVGSVSMQDVLPFLLIGGGLLGFSIIKQVLEALGIWDSKDTKDLDGAVTEPNSFWNPNFWQLKPDSVPWTYAITEQTARIWCEEIYDSMNGLNDKEEVSIGIFKRCRTQANASFICWVFNKYYGQDLLKWLRGGLWPQDRLSDSDVNEINQYVNQLPKY